MMARQWIRVYVDNDEDAAALLNALAALKISSLTWDGHFDLWESECEVCGAVKQHDLSLDYDHAYKDKDGYDPNA